MQGFGFHEAPRGALSHWVVIKDGVIDNYQAVVPTTWNASPRDDKQARGPYEASLIGNPVVDNERPLEVVRTIQACEQLGIKTVFLTSEDDATDAAPTMLEPLPEADAIVSTSFFKTRTLELPDMPPVQRVIGVPQKAIGPELARRRSHSPDVSTSPADTW